MLKTSDTTTSLIDEKDSDEFLNTSFLKKPKNGIKRIVCVGDSLTQGFEDNSHTSYPDVLKDQISDDKFEVINLGLIGRTMLKTGDSSQWKETKQKIALESYADIIILMFGTNDSMIQNWNEGKFIDDYIEMSRSFLLMPTKPKLYLMIPPPLQKEGYENMQQTVINQRFPILIPEIASRLNLPYEQIINLFELLGGNKLNKWEQFSQLNGQGKRHDDACHPNDLGNSVIAAAVQKSIFAQENPFNKLY